MPESVSRRLTLGVVVALLLASTVATAQPLTKTITSGTVSCPVVNCLQVSMLDIQSLGIDITGTGTWEIVVQGLRGPEGTATWTTVSTIADADLAAVTSMTAAGAWSLPNSGFSAIRIYPSSYTSGSPVVSVTPGRLAPLTAAGSGGGGDASEAEQQAQTLLLDSMDSRLTDIESAVDGLETAVGNLLTTSAFQTAFGAGSVVTNDPCDGAVKTRYVLSVSTATTTEIANAVSGEFFYICSVVVSTTGAQTVAFVEDDTDGVGSPTDGLNGGVTAATGWSFPATGGIVLGNGGSWVLKTGTANRYLGVITGQATQTSIAITYVSAP